MDEIYKEGVIMPCAGIPGVKQIRNGEAPVSGVRWKSRKQARTYLAVKLAHAVLGGEVCCAVLCDRVEAGLAVILLSVGVCSPWAVGRLHGVGVAVK